MAMFINFSKGKYSLFDTYKVQCTSQNLDGRNPFSFAKFVLFYVECN